jgi:hypothetical protein
MRWSVLAVGLLVSTFAGSAAGGASREATSACTWRAITLKPGPLVAEKTEQATLPLVLTSRARRACVLKGYPSLALFDRRGRLLPFRYGHRGDQMITGARPRLVRLRSGASAFIALNKNACEGSHTGTARTLTLRLPGSHEARTMRLGRYPILDYCGTGFFQRVTASPFERRPGDTGCYAQGSCERRK